MIRRAFLTWRPWLGPFANALAERLQRNGVEVHVYVSQHSQLDWVKAGAPAGAFARISTSQLMYDLDATRAGDDAYEVARALEHEAWLGMPFAKLMVADRHFGRGYALGGPRFPTSVQSRASHKQALASYSSQIEFWRREIEVHRPDVILEGNSLLATVAESAGIPFRTLAASRHKNFYYWSETAYLETSALRPAWEALARSGKPVTIEAVEPAAAMIVYWNVSGSKGTWRYFLRASGKQVMTRIRHRVRGRKISPKYDLMSNIAYLNRQRRQVRRMTRAPMKRLQDIKDGRFVFFPLGTEPELGLQGLSPEYFFQLETIAAISRDLPADTLLAVKEHLPACGARADLFYDQIAAFKNVVMLDLRESGVEVIRNAAATVCVSGSAGFEAAAMGKSTIVLGRHNIFDFLPHVRVVADIAELGAALDDALSGRLAGPAAIQDGSLMLAAIESISFDMATYDPYTPNSKVVDETAESAYRLLIESLQDSGSLGRQSHA